MRARHPHLLDLTDPPALKASRCPSCERVAFPPEPYGCERCGAPAADAQPTTLAARGTIHAVVTVHRHHHPHPATPFVVATIVLDDGPTLKAVVIDSTDPKIGDRVEGCLEQVPSTDPAPSDSDNAAHDGHDEVVDLRFRVTEEVDR